MTGDEWLELEDLKDLKDLKVIQLKNHIEKFRYLLGADDTQSMRALFDLYLIERAAIGKMPVFRYLPAAKNFVDGK